MRLRRAFSAGLECARPECTRRFIRGSAEDAKFESNGESSSTQPQTQDSGRLEDAEAAKPEGARIRAT